MKKRVIMTCMVVILILTMSSVTALAYSASKNSISESDNSSIVIKVSELNSIDEIKCLGKKMVGNYLRREAEIEGKISLDASRVNISEVNEWINNNYDYKQICSKLQEKYVFPDYVGGSGITITEYWLDDNGDEKIMLINQNQEILHVTDANNTTAVNYQIIFSPNNK